MLLINRFMTINTLIISMPLIFTSGPIAQSVVRLTADLGVMSLFPTLSHAFVEIGHEIISTVILGAQWLSDRVLDFRPRGRRVKPHWRHCVVALKQDTFILT